MGLSYLLEKVVPAIGIVKIQFKIQSTIYCVKRIFILYSIKLPCGHSLDFENWISFVFEMHIISHFWRHLAYFSEKFSNKSDSSFLQLYLNRLDIEIFPMKSSKILTTIAFQNFSAWSSLVLALVGRMQKVDKFVLIFIIALFHQFLFPLIEKKQLILSLSTTVLKTDVQKCSDLKIS